MKEWTRVTKALSVWVAVWMTLAIFGIYFLFMRGR